MGRKGHKISCVCSWCCVGAPWGEIPALAVVENAWNVWGNSLWKFPVKVLWSSSSWTQWFQRSDSMVLEVFSSFSDAVIIFHDSKFHLRSWKVPVEVPHCFKLTRPGLYIIFTAFSTAQCNPRAAPGESVLGWSRLALALHYPNPTWAAFWESWGWSSTDWSRSLLRPSPQHCLSFVLIPA